MEEHHSFLPSLSNWWVNIVRKSLSGLLSWGIQEMQETNFHHLPARDSTTSGRSWPSMKSPFLAVRTSNPISCSHFRAVSTDICLGKPGSSVELGSSDLLTLQNSTVVRFGLPLTAALPLTYSEVLLVNSSFAHSTPVLWYCPCFRQRSLRWL